MCSESDKADAPNQYCFSYGAGLISIDSAGLGNIITYSLLSICPQCTHCPAEKTQLCAKTGGSEQDK